MKTFAQRTLVALVICALATFSALAGIKVSKVKTTVTFAQDTRVNGTMVKAGSYNLELDKETGELAIKKGDKVVATAHGRLVTRANKARETELRTVGNELVAVSIAGLNQDGVLKESGGSTTGNTNN